MAQATFLHHRTRKPLRFCRLNTLHLRGTRLKGIRGCVFPWVRIPRYRLQRAVVFRDSSGREWTVPKGFVFNGLSVPWELWWLCPPGHSDAFAASCIHDWLCVKKAVSSTRANEIFYEAMEANGMYKLGTGRNYLGVKIFGPRFDADVRVRLDLYRRKLLRLEPLEWNGEVWEQVYSNL